MSIWGIAKTHLQVCSKLCIANLMTYGSQLLSFIAKKKLHLPL